MITLNAKVQDSAFIFSAECAVCGGEIAGQWSLDKIPMNGGLFLRAVLSSLNFTGVKAPGFFVCSDTCMANAHWSVPPLPPVVIFEPEEGNDNAN